MRDANKGEGEEEKQVLNIACGLDAVLSAQTPQ
jgi:hypothetical protein